MMELPEAYQRHASGSSRLLEAITRQGRPVRLAFEVGDKAYETQHITIKDKRKVNPEKRDMERIGREQKIIRERRLTEETVTLEELGKELGVSKERVRQLESRALNKLRDSISNRMETPLDLLLEG